VLALELSRHGAGAVLGGGSGTGHDGGAAAKHRSDDD
jgi:hypothetical protein